MLPGAEGGIDMTGLSLATGDVVQVLARIGKIYPGGTRCDARMRTECGWAQVTIVCRAIEGVIADPEDFDRVPP
jgi:hypothetical protein